MIRISVFYDGEPVKDFEQGEVDKEITIGRSAGCAIQLDETSISRLHALVRFQAGSWILERKANFGAVLLNGQEVENAPLEGGEEITIGKFVLRVNIENEGSQSKSLASIQADGDGRTKVISTGVNALFRFEPGSANLTEFLMQKDLAIFGRGSNCDVVLTEKKASRKHCEIRRQGLSFFLKDLNSSNGTEVNGSSIKEVELVPGDVIQVGESKFQFSIENKEYFNQQDQFMPVPSHMEVPDATAGQYPMSAPGSIPGFAGESSPEAGITGIDSGSSEPEPQSLVGKVRKRYLALNTRQRYIAIGVAFIFITSFLSMLLGDPNEEPKRVKPKPKVVNGQVVRTIDQLSPAQQKFVKQNYVDLIAANEKKDYQRMLESCQKILTYVDEYKDTKDYERQAKKKLDEIEEARRRDELKAKQDKIRAEVQALEDKGKIVFARALEDPKARPELEGIIQEIYSRDPNNRVAGDWKVKIKEKDEEDKREAELARQKEELKQRAESAYADVEKIFKEDKFLIAIAEADKLDAIGYSEKEYTDRVEALKNRIRDKLTSILSPKLRDAAAQRVEGGDLVKAKELYLEVLKIDSTNREAQNGLDAIRETLHVRAKRYYAEAILAESVSDLAEAKEKYEKCLKFAPEEDIYKRRCKNKLSRFDGLAPSGG